MLIDIIVGARPNFMKIAPLISHRFPIDDAEAAYALIGSSAPSLGVLLQYPHAEPVWKARDSTLRVALPSKQSKVVIGFVGAGNYASGVLIPAFAKSPARLKTVTSASGVSGSHVAKKVGIEFSSTDNDALLGDNEVNAPKHGVGVR